MMSQASEKATDDPQRTTKLQRPQNNETIEVYDNHTIQHHYDGYPAQGIVQYDITGYEFIEFDFEDNDETVEDLYESFEQESRDFIDRILFEADTTTSLEVSFNVIDSTTIEIDTGPETYVIELGLENKQRIE